MARKKQAESDRHRLRIKAFDLLRRGKTQSEIAKSCGVSIRTIQRWVNESQEKVKQQGDLVAVVAETLSPQSNSVVEKLFSQDFFQKLDALMPSCLQELESILKDPDSRKQDKIRVCQVLGDWTGLSGGLSGSIIRVIAAGYLVSEPCDSSLDS
jgi:transcriptional regulator with XRE-family HTH domain